MTDTSSTAASVTYLGADGSHSPSPHLAFGIDIGGSGVKGAIVDLHTGEFVGDRHRIPTPSPATPDAVARTCAQITDHFGWTGPVGVTVPAVVRDGVVASAANIDESWIGVDLQELFGAHLHGRTVVGLNDADAAGLAELRYGVGHASRTRAAESGTVILLTIGTGIGSALFRDGVLVPNTELGHLEIGGREAEHRASAKARDDHGWSLQKWSRKLSRVLRHYEFVFSPDLFVVGGGISRKADTWIPMLSVETPVVPAELRNSAGIVGAAMTVDEGLRM
ncbi:putative polyphosphate glucokinase PpgK [Gordonia spumicola]|uniref:Putative polyphosphate glucokinase PpgK n=1 Tax=Gordonia spumicola TaxID=589161 RepID=A0A7I9VBG5_9ACTN|nr:ROK family protein [Gordonia spumicola]GEE02614.1 putative polyphosphate glucokinase PpgK [Gordonia spumicola]